MSVKRFIQIINNNQIHPYVYISNFASTAVRIYKSKKVRKHAFAQDKKKADSRKKERKHANNQEK